MPLNDNIGLLVLGRWQINARTELALRYNDISPLENHHCSVAFNILEDPTANIFRLMDRDTFKSVREGMIRCILATDMARHNEIVNQFGQIIPVFDYDNRAHVNLVSIFQIQSSPMRKGPRVHPPRPWRSIELAAGSLAHISRRTWPASCGPSLPCGSS